MFPFLQDHDLRRLVVPVLIFAPRIVSRAFWDGRPTGYGRSPRTIILEFRVLVAIFVWDPRDAALKLAQKSGCVLTVCKAGGELVLRWLFRRSHRRGEQAGMARAGSNGPYKRFITNYTFLTIFIYYTVAAPNTPCYLAPNI
jgi:hypothetical protein